MKKKLIIIGLIVFGLVSGGILFWLFNREIKEPSDITRFINEFEQYNYQQNKTGDTYPLVKIADYTPVSYASSSEIVTFMKQGTGVIFLGSATCPWTRTSLPIFLQALFNSNIENFLYFDITTIQSTIIAKNGEAVVEKKGTNDYYQILDQLDAYLSPYQGLDENLVQVDFTEKRIMTPTYVFVDEGKIIGFHELTVPEQENGYQKLTTQQEEQLYNIYRNYISQISSIDCGSVPEEEC